jgi:GNAT superfamily N-acetyltransferase
MSLDISIEQFDIRHFGRLAELFGSYFKLGDKLLDSTYSKWLYGQNPFGSSRMVIASDAGRWVGFMAMVPAHLFKQGTQVIVYYVVNVLVHPEFHGKHVFGRMITAAKELAQKQNTVLMGHPNDMAIKSWQRSKMHFVEPLRAGLVVPRFHPRGVEVVEVTRIDQLLPVWPMLKAQIFHADHWCLGVTGDYVAWRYLTHPVNQYRIQRVDVAGSSVGFMVTKKVRPGVSLLVDQFLVDCHTSTALACLPWLTVSFRPQTVMRELSGAIWPLPIKKQLPFFFTKCEQPANASDVMYLGLSTSDF